MTLRSTTPFALSAIVAGGLVWSGAGCGSTRTTTPTTTPSPTAAPPTATPTPTICAGCPRAFIAIHGTTSSDNRVAVLDTGSLRVVAYVTVGSEPWGVAVSPSGSFVYVANSNAGTVSVIRRADLAVVATIAVGTGPSQLVHHPTLARLYVTNWNDNSVSVVDSGTYAALATIPVGNSPSGIEVTPNGSFVYVANWSSNPGQLSVIGTGSNAVVATVTLAGTNGPTGIAVSPSGSRLYAGCVFTTNIAAVDPLTQTLVGTPANVNGWPRGNVRAHPDGSRLFVAQYTNDKIAELALPAMTITRELDLGANRSSPGHPWGVALSPDGSTLYGTSTDGGDLSVVPLGSGIESARVAVGPGPYGIVVVP